MTCPKDGTPCVREVEWVDPLGTPVISDDEFICRAGYSPMHRKADGEPKPSLIRLPDLQAGTLSVWRLNGPAQFSVADAVEELAPKAPAPNSLWTLFAVPASEIRRFLPEDGARLFCVINDTDCGNGKQHQAHAAIAVCHRYEALASEQLDNFLRQARAILVNIFRAGRLWRAPDQA